MDTKVNYISEVVCQYMVLLLGQFIMVCVLYPYFTIPFLIFLTIIIIFDLILNRGIAETKRLDNQLKAPVIHHITTSVDGLMIIRGFRRQEMFLKKFQNHLNTSLAADTMSHYSIRWFMWRMEVLGVVAITTITAFCIFFKSSGSVGVAGVALSSICNAINFIPSCMLMKARLMAFMNSLERNLEYTTLDQEAPVVVEDKRPSQGWPQQGQISLKKICFRYRPELPLVLHNISLEVDGGLKIGVVGRTGAGKSSLISALLRLSELDSGAIIIDGIDIR